MSGKSPLSTRNWSSIGETYSSFWSERPESIWRVNASFLKMWDEGKGGFQHCQILWVVFKFELCENSSRETEIEDAKKGSLTILVHADTRAHAFLTITTNICWEGCEKGGSSCHEGIKKATSSLYFRGWKKLGIDVLFLTWFPAADADTCHMEPFGRQDTFWPNLSFGSLHFEFRASPICPTTGHRC